MKKLLLTLSFVMLSLMGFCQKAGMAETRMEFIEENIAKPATCDAISICIEQKMGTAAQCQQKALKEGKCDLKLFGLDLVIGDERRRTSTSGKVSVDLEEVLRDLFEKLVIHSEFDKTKGRLFTIKNKSTGELMYERKLSFAGEGLYASTSGKAFSTSRINVFSGRKISSAADTRKILTAFFDQLTISLTTAK